MFLDMDNGESLRELFLKEEQLFKNNYPQVVLAHAASSMACNYDLIIKKFNGCAIPVLKGPPVCGKTSALKAVMSVFGIRRFTSGRHEIFNRPGSLGSCLCSTGLCVCEG